jgi:hypothetical protein
LDFFTCVGDYGLYDFTSGGFFHILLEVCVAIEGTVGKVGSFNRWLIVR